MAAVVLCAFGDDPYVYEFAPEVVGIPAGEASASKFVWASDGTPANGAEASTITVKYSGVKTGVFKYSADIGKYLVEEYNKAYVDGNTDTQVAVTNVLVIHTGVKNIPGDTDGRKDISLTGSGTGYFACGGKYIPIRWEKPSATAPFRFLTADGQPLSLGVGKSYINVADPSYPLTFE